MSAENILKAQRIVSMSWILGSGTAALKGQCIFLLNIPSLFSKAIVNFYLLCHARWASLVAQMVESVCSAGDLGREAPLEEGRATHSSILAWRIPWTEEPGGLQSIGLQGVEHDWSDLARTYRILQNCICLPCVNLKLEIGSWNFAKSIMRPW